LENSDAKSVLVTTCCKISCFLKTTAKKLGDQYIIGPPKPKSWGYQFLPVSAVVAPMREGVPERASAGKCRDLGGRDYGVLGVTIDNVCLYWMFVTSISAYRQHLPDTATTAAWHLLVNNPLTSTRRNYKTEVCIFTVSRQCTRQQNRTVIAQFSDF